MLVIMKLSHLWDGVGRESIILNGELIIRNPKLIIPSGDVDRAMSGLYNVSTHPQLYWKLRLHGDQFPEQEHSCI